MQHLPQSQRLGLIVHVTLTGLGVSEQEVLESRFPFQYLGFGAYHLMALGFSFLITGMGHVLPDLQTSHTSSF